MNIDKLKNIKLSDKASSLTSIILITLFALLPIRVFWVSIQERINIESDLVKAEQTIFNQKIKIDKYEEILQINSDNINDLENNLSETTSELKQKVKENKILEKLTTLDPELLKKYSKVFFLNENYSPEELRDVPDEFVLRTDKTLEIHRDVWPFLEELLVDAKDADLNLYIASGYRSYDEQHILKSAYSVQYGSGANAFSADQGYSEHQLGTTIDFTTIALNGGLSGFQNTPEYKWLLKNAHKYGFVISYPENNTHYIFEPWHWRFVGEKLAEDIYDSGEDFYDWDQREIDKYLIDIFS